MAMMYMPFGKLLAFQIAFGAGSIRSTTCPFILIIFIHAVATTPGGKEIVNTSPIFGEVNFASFVISETDAVTDVRTFTELGSIRCELQK